jgi:hypothetical protein
MIEIFEAWPLRDWIGLGVLLAVWVLFLLNAVDRRG